MTTLGPGEVLLPGGTANRGLVVRVGDTVRRPRRASSPSTDALLRHLQDVGFEGAPRLLGVDRRGREVLAYIPGETLTPPYPAWAFSEPTLASVARLLRGFHDAVASFDPAGLGWARPVPDRFLGGLVSHNDPNIDNFVFRSGQAVAIIDFDLAAPGSALWDVAAAARLWAPLRPDGDIDDDRRGRGLARFRLLLDAYGVDDADRDQVVDAVSVNHRWCMDLVRQSAEQGHAGFGERWFGWEAVLTERTDAWLQEQDTALRTAARG